MAETNTQRVLRILLSPAAQLEATMQAVLHGFSIDTAVGAQLDIVGARVGLAREGETDDEIYRAHIRARVVANKSSGIINDVLKVARLVINNPTATITLHNYGIATYSLEIGGIALTESIAQVLVRLIVKATSGGVRPIVEYAISAPGDVFQFDDGPGFDVGRYSTAVDHVI